ncbi:MAG TPA: hypothetical protein VNZ94_00565 [Xanthobacteraceae bacterium]|nr:hypothetical protein [Xanthobacteraceae bacterium]
MSSYEQSLRERRSFMAQEFGGDTQTFTIRGPKGKRGIVRDIEVETTEAMVGTTTVPEINVGKAANDDSFARFRLGTAVGAGYGAGVKRALSLVSGNGAVPTLEDFPGHIMLETDFLPADTDAVITLKEGVGGVPAGTANVHVDIEWF